MRGTSPKSSPASERFAIFIICVPLTYLFGRLFFKILLASLAAADLFTFVARILAVELVGALLMFFLFASIWTVTGRQWFDGQLTRWFTRMILISLIASAVLILFALIFG